MLRKIIALSMSIKYFHPYHLIVDGNTPDMDTKLIFRKTSLVI